MFGMPILILSFTCADMVRAANTHLKRAAPIRDLTASNNDKIEKDSQGFG
jgi:hypothetical protein